MFYHPSTASCQISWLFVSYLNSMSIPNGVHISEDSKLPSANEGAHSILVFLGLGNLTQNDCFQSFLLTHKLYNFALLTTE